MLLKVHLLIITGMMFITVLNLYAFYIKGKRYFATAKKRKLMLLFSKVIYLGIELKVDRKGRLSRWRSIVSVFLFIHENY